MEFDKSKVYTALNADELKVGSKVILADDLGSLKDFVENDENIWKLNKIQEENSEYRFTGGSIYYHLAYLVEEPEEGKLRWNDLKVGDIIKNNKERKIAMVVQIDVDCDDFNILAGDEWLGDEDFDDWEKVEE